MMATLDTTNIETFFHHHEHQLLEANHDGVGRLRYIHREPPIERSDLETINTFILIREGDTLHITPGLQANGHEPLGYLLTRKFETPPAAQEGST